MRLKWDEVGQKEYELGVSHGVLFPQDSKGQYPKGVVWNGLINVTESPGGAEPTDLYADNIKYASMRSAETFGATVEAYMYPPEFGACDGSKEAAPGVSIGQQDRQMFGLCYRTEVGNDTATEEDDGYKLHLIYGCTASPSEKSYGTISDSPEAITFSWEIQTTPVNIEGFKPTSSIIIDSRKVDAAKLKKLEDILYGSDDSSPEAVVSSQSISMSTKSYSSKSSLAALSDALEARLPLPNEVIEIFKED